jgi:hypothetical protein
MTENILITAGSFFIPIPQRMAGILANLEIIQEGRNGDSTGAGHTPLTSDILPE